MSSQRPCSRCKVRDAGIGIPSEHLERIFERFHRVDARLTRTVDGLGLGLAISKRIVELHGGAIWAESEPSHGSTFVILLPIAEERE
jgi:signal transduction histidine kinase